MIPDADADPHFYRLEKALVGGRLIPVVGEDEATHVDVVALRRAVAAHARDRAELAERAAELDRAGQRIRDLELQLARAVRRAEQADILVAGHQSEMTRYGASVRRLLAKNAALIGEKRRLRDALVGKHPLPAVHYRVDLDHDDVARESRVVTLDAFPHRDRVSEALAEGRRVAARHGGRLRTLRLDTSAWRAVVQRPAAEQEVTSRLLMEEPMHDEADDHEREDSNRDRDDAGEGELAGE